VRASPVVVQEEREKKGERDEGVRAVARTGLARWFAGLGPC
jgi:hypothetical protein